MVVSYNEFQQAKYERAKKIFERLMDESHNGTEKDLNWEEINAMQLVEADDKIEIIKGVAKKLKKNKKS
ncbi:MAG: hypothetical protein LBV67_02005 [Streptococcaceae bacterium]|jgi:hypothetical protein|nr:hypothetical protein [Streptococcaceae bacterium]